MGRPVGELASVSLVAAGVRADAGRLTAYQHLLGERASDELPAGFVHVLTFGLATALMVRADFPLPLAGLVHVANRIEQRRPVTLGEELEVRAHAQALRPHRRGTQVELVTEVHARGDDAYAWRGVSTYLARGLHLPGAPTDDVPSARASAGAARPARPTAAADASTSPVPTGQWRLAADVGRRYAAVSGDCNPIHLSALSARALGFPRAIAHGMYTAGRALASVGSARTDAFTWTVEFGAPVLLPATVLVRIAPDGPDGAFAYAGWNPRSGRTHLTGAVLPAGVPGSAAVAQFAG
ncbi:MaoC/PaaZ C-terminal domain-containing protein [Pengzhenrongella sicca]|nr:MaoC/PaaZ C-terminal domain-containing protein [Pengzhenrongella sicca]